MSLSSRLTDLAVRIGQEIKSLRAEVDNLGTPVVPSFQQVTDIGATTNRQIEVTGASTSATISAFLMGISSIATQAYTGIMTNGFIFIVKNASDVATYTYLYPGTAVTKNITLPDATGKLTTETKVSEMIAASGGGGAGNTIVISSTDPVPVGTPSGTLIIRVAPLP